MTSSRYTNRFLSVIPAILAAGMVPASAQTPEKMPNAATGAGSAIEPLAPGNYWTTKETTFAADGEIDSEGFVTVRVTNRETLGGRPCFQMRQTYHDTPRFDPKLVESSPDGDSVHWEFLEDGNLYYFDSVEAPDPAPSPDAASGASPDRNAAEAADDPAADPAPGRFFTAENPALYLKYPASPGDLYQSFDTVGTVIATDRLVETPAGKFICHVYGFLTDAAETLPHRSYTVEYWCPGVGFVKLEEYEINGAESRLIYAMELIAYHLENDRSGGDADGDGRRSKIENVR